MHMYASLLLAAAASIRSSIAQNASSVPTNPYCQGECRANFTAAWETDSKMWVAANTTDDAFYDLPQNLSLAQSGDILRWQDLDPAAVNYTWNIPSGQSLSRFQYATLDLDGSIVAASAFILLPYAPRHGQGKIRALAWTHGTSGISSVCAPSNHKSLYYDWSAPFAFAQLGYAVIAPDYAGMGSVTPKGFQYSAQWTHAADIAFSVVAAKQRLGNILTDDWVSLGQSEGGAAAWRLNQRLAVPGQKALLKAEGYLGSVAIAPANRPVDLLDYLRGRPPSADGGLGQVSVYMLKSVSNLYPELRLEDYLTEAGLGRMNLVLESCVYGGFYAVSYMSDDELWKRNDSWTEHPAARKWSAEYNHQNLTALAEPLLIVQGTNDGIVPYPLVMQDYNTTCASEPHASVTLLTYEGQDHDTVTSSAQGDYLQWVEDLFKGKKVKMGCARTDVHPLTDHWQKVAHVYEPYA